MAIKRNPHRDATKRTEIHNEVIQGLTSLKLHDDPRAAKLITELTIFLNDTTGRQFDGNIEFIDRGFSIEYCLPGRRIIQHFVRTRQLEKQ